MTRHVTALVAVDATVPPETEVGAFAILGIDGEGSPLQVGSGATFRSHSVVYRGTVIGDRFHAGHGALIREATHIGNDCSIGSHSVVEHHVQVEDGVRLHTRCFVPEHSVLRRGSWLGPGVTVTNARYPNRPDTKAQLQGVVVGEGAVVGANAVLLPGVSVGEGAVVGAGAVVVADVAPGDVVVGNPARVIR